MIVAMQEKATEEQIEPSSTPWWMRSQCSSNHGAYQTILAGVGPTANVELRKFELLPGVLYVHRITAPISWRPRFRPEGTQVEFAHGVKVGGDRTHVMAGPCSIETREQMFETAARVKAAAAAFSAEELSNRAVLLTPSRAWHSWARADARSRGCAWAAHRKRGDGNRADRTHAAIVDCFQVGRATCKLQPSARAGPGAQAGLLKRGIAATIEELLLSSEYIMSGGNYDVILCERGIRTYETSTRNTMDISAIPVLKKLSHSRWWPIHRTGTGRRDMVAPMARPPWPRVRMRSWSKFIQRR